MTIKEYLNRPYHIVIQYITDETGSYYYAYVSELAGCMCQGSSYAEAYEKIQEAMKEWIEARLAAGAPVPEPVDERQFSGRIALRIPKTLHGQLAMEAKREGISINQYLLYKLSG
ncbi:MAG: type II toxin-antitoxin system HicB family antitoxin [Spirochaetes bacterium]|nr:type II toxin-antitoxin system HicB family antitoxin [Spirochaetota bacterium]